MFERSSGEYRTYDPLDERRAEPRVPSRVPAVAVFEGRPHRYRLRDVSLGGALLDRAGEPAPPPVHTMILRAGGRTLRVLARTVWVRGDAHGVRFIAQSDVDRLELGELIDALATMLAPSRVKSA